MPEPKGQVSQKAKPSGPAKAKQKLPNTPPKPQPENQTQLGQNQKSSLGLTVRIEINLPADGSKETYDNIFKSIKENLLGG